MTHVDAALIEAVDGLVEHALDRTGLWLRRRLPRRDRGAANRIEPRHLHLHVPVDREQLARRGVVEEALQRAREVAARHRVDPDWLTRTVAGYVRDLVTAGVAHRHSHLPQLLRDAPRVNAGTEGGAGA